MKIDFLKKWPVFGAGVILLSATLQPALYAQEKEKSASGPLVFLLNQRKKKDLAMAINNSKQLFYLMVEFDGDYGDFPSDQTADENKDLSGYKGKNSNDYLAQFIAAGYTRSEEIFYARGGSKAKKKPDNDTTTKAKRLEAGECGFTYIKGLSVSNNSMLPLLVAPMTGKGVKFDPKPYNGKAIVLRIDGSVKTYNIDAKGDVILPNGKKLFEDGKDTPWGEKGFDAKMLMFPK